MLTQLFNWFVFSSANPEKLALTVKGIATLAIPVVMFALQLKGIVVTEEQVGDWFEQGVLILQQVLVIFGGLMTLVGFARKLFITIRTVIFGA